MKNAIEAIALLTLLAFTHCCNAQLQSPYIFQKDDTVLAKKFYEQTMLKKKERLASIGTEYSKDYKEVYTDSYDGIAAYWKSSRLVTAPDAHQYLQSVVQKILVANPELRNSDARVVFYRDDIPNASSLGDGSIIFHAGLLLYLDNEAELVFVLSHELAHYYLNHSEKRIKKVVETINSEQFKSEVKRLKKEEYRVGQQIEQLVKTIVFDGNRHSRENEAEADHYAFRFMKKTGYDCGSIRSLLTLLDRIDDSLLHQPISLEKVFNFPDYPFKKKWTQQQSAIFSKLDANDSPLTPAEKDSLKTHPDCTKRIQMLADSIALQPSGRKFIVDENRFRQLQKDFAREIAEQYYREENLGRHLYYSLALMQQEENTSLTVYSIVRTLNDIYESQRDHTLGLKVGSESRTSAPDYNLLMRMLSRLRLDEIAAINYYFCRQYTEKMKDVPGFEKEKARAIKHFTTVN